VGAGGGVARWVHGSSLLGLGGDPQVVAGMAGMSLPVFLPMAHKRSLELKVKGSTVGHLHSVCLGFIAGPSVFLSGINRHSLSTQVSTADAD
jgi:hypothetical protein